MSTKARRQAAILDLVGRAAVRSQEQLRRRLRGLGLDATQATLSRDIKDLGLVKRAADGAYQPSGEAAGSPVSATLALERAIGEYATRVARVRQLVVVRTGTGQAQPLGVAIDRAQLSEIVGTLAGDDTILVIARDSRRASQVLRRFETLMRK